MLFILFGLLFAFWGVGLINIFLMFNFILAIALIFYGERYMKHSESKNIGRGMILIGIILLISRIVSFKFILALLFFIVGVYFLLFKSRVFVLKSGIFKDSRNDVYVKEMFSQISINNISSDISSIKVKSFFSNLNLDFVNSKMVTKDLVNFEINAVFSNVKINVNSEWNVIFNGDYIRKVQASNKTISIKCSNLFGMVEVI